MPDAVSFKIMRDRVKQTKPLAESSEFEDASDGLSNVEFYDDDVEVGGDVPTAYEESEWETTTVRCCGAFACVLLGVLTLSWIVHAIPISTVTDIPPFARSMIWMSIAHHTDAWKAQQGSISPPPPAFGDGLGNFPDQLTA